MGVKILVIEDDADVRANMLDLLEAEGFEPCAAANGEEGVALAVKHLPDVIVCDVNMPGIDGHEVFDILSSKPATAVIPFIFVSGNTERGAVRRGMTLGADDYITKPFTRAELLSSIRARLHRTLLLQGQRPGSAEPASKRPRPSSGPAAGQVVVVDPAMQALYRQIDRVADSGLSVLILGETGVGKEIVAEQLHLRSGRPGPFVPINCAALSESLIESELFGHEKGAFTGAQQAKEGVFEAAHGGTLFLDEVGDLPLSTQVKLLRVLEDRKVTRVGGRGPRAVDVRFVSATHRDVEGQVAAGTFRQDLFFRLNGISLEVPPLRERRADVAPLVEYFVGQACARGSRPRAAPTLANEAREALERYRWPGNIRELRNVVERAVVLCDGEELGVAHFPPAIARPVVASVGERDSQPGDARTMLLSRVEDLERQKVVDALAACAGNQTQAADLLGISRRTLVTRLATYNLPRPRKRE